MRDPGARRNLDGDSRELTVRDAEQDELCAFFAQLDAPLGQAGGNRGAHSAPSDDIHAFHFLSSSSVADPGKRF